MTLENRPGTPARPSEPPSDVYLGIQGQDIEGGEMPDRHQRRRPGGKAGLEEGDVVQAVEGQPIANYAALAEQIRNHKAGDDLRLKVRRGESNLELVAKLELRPGANRPYSFSLGGQAVNVQDQQPVPSDTLPSPFCASTLRTLAVSLRNRSMSASPSAAIDHAHPSRPRTRRIMRGSLLHRLRPALAERAVGAGAQIGVEVHDVRLDVRVAVPGGHLDVAGPALQDLRDQRLARA